MTAESILSPEIKRVLITGGAGFIGGCLVRRLLRNTDVDVFNLDKIGYASDLSSIENISVSNRHHLLRVDLKDAVETAKALEISNPDLVMHLAAESHVDRSIDSPIGFLESNIFGTYNLLEAVRSHWDNLSPERKKRFRFHHISTDEVFGSLGSKGRFNEKSQYDPRSPYSATKASSDHLVNAWHHTFGLPVVLTNCSNNFGPWQFPEKLIPVVILKAVNLQPIPIYGDGLNVRDWLYVEDHVDALLLVANKGQVGQNYCVGGYGERTNKLVVENICNLLDKYRHSSAPHDRLITYVKDRPGHDQRYAIDSTRITSELGWEPKYNFEEGLEKTIIWYLNNLEWCAKVRENANYYGRRIGTVGL